MNGATLLLLLLAMAPQAPGPASSAAAAGEPAEVLVEAHAAYEAGEYRRAAALYQALVGRGIDNGHLHYNLGNAYLRNGELGRAVAAYLCSRSLLPRDEDVAANLEFARRSARDALRPPEPSPVLTTLFFWHYRLSRPELLRLVVVANALLWGLLALSLFRRRPEALRWLAAVLAAVVLATGGSLALRTFRPQRVAVVVPQQIDVHAATRADSVVRFQLHAGAEVAVTEIRDGWLRIRLPGGEQGWIEDRHAEMVEI